MRTIPKKQKKTTLVDLELSVKTIEEKTAEKVGEPITTVYKLVCDDDPKKRIKLTLTRGERFKGAYPGQDVRVVITSQQSTLPIEEE